MFPLKGPVSSQVWPHSKRVDRCAGWCLVCVGCCVADQLHLVIHQSEAAAGCGVLPDLVLQQAGDVDGEGEEQEPDQHQPGGTRARTGQPRKQTIKYRFFS